MPFLPELTAEHGERLQMHITDEGNSLDVDALVADIASDEAAESAELYMCGPITLTNALRHSWKRAALPPTNLRSETFGYGGRFMPEEFVVRVPRYNVHATVGADESLLEALERVGVEVMSGCRKGACGLCRLAVLDMDGQIDHHDVFLSDSQKAPRITYVLVCRASSAGFPCKRSVFSFLTFLIESPLSLDTAAGPAINGSEAPCPATLAAPLKQRGPRRVRIAVMVAASDRHPVRERDVDVREIRCRAALLRELCRRDDHRQMRLDKYASRSAFASGVLNIAKTVAVIELSRC